MSVMADNFDLVIEVDGREFDCVVTQEMLAAAKEILDVRVAMHDKYRSWNYYGYSHRKALFNKRDLLKRAAEKANPSLQNRSSPRSRVLANILSNETQRIVVDNETYEQAYKANRDEKYCNYVPKYFMPQLFKPYPAEEGVSRKEETNRPEAETVKLKPSEIVAQRRNLPKRPFRIGANCGN
jgi:hypothetical protein